MITYNQYLQLCVRQRLLAVTCLSWRDFLRKQDLFHYADAGSLPFWCHYRHLGPPIIPWLHLSLWFYCFITFCTTSTLLPLSIDWILILIFVVSFFSLIPFSFKWILSVFNFTTKDKQVQVSLHIFCPSECPNNILWITEIKRYNIILILIQLMQWFCVLVKDRPRHRCCSTDLFFSYNRHKHWQILSTILLFTVLEKALISLFSWITRLWTNPELPVTIKTNTQVNMIIWNFFRRKNSSYLIDYIIIN